MTKLSEELMPLVSIVIPVYNGGSYLAEAIESALSQTYPRIELLVVDDGSRDGGATQRVARSFGSRLRLISKPNGGVASALNAAIGQMQGDYFAWLSHDDLFLPDKIKAEMDAVRASGNADTIVFGDYENFTDRDGTVGRSDFLSRYGQDQMETPLFAVFHRAVHGCTVLIHRTHFERVGKFREDLLTTQDYEFWARLMRGQTLRFLPQALIRSRIHSAQGSRSMPVRHLYESDDLWIGLLNGLTDTERSALAPSAAAFYGELQKEFSQETPYRLTAAYLASRRDMAEAVESIPIGGIVQVASDPDGMLSVTWREGGERISVGGLAAWCGSHHPTGAAIILDSRNALCLAETLADCGLCPAVLLADGFCEEFNNAALRAQLDDCQILKRASRVDCTQVYTRAQISLLLGRCALIASTGLAIWPEVAGAVLACSEEIQNAYLSRSIRLADQEALLEQVKIERDQANRTLEEMQQSLSWRITAPLRVVKQMIRRG